MLIILLFLLLCYIVLCIFFCRQIPLENLQGDYYPAAHGTQKYFFVPHTQPRQEFQNAHRPRHLFSEKLNGFLKRPAMLVYQMREHKSGIPDKPPDRQTCWFIRLYTTFAQTLYWRVFPGSAC